LTKFLKILSYTFVTIAPAWAGREAWHFAAMLSFFVLPGAACWQGRKKKQGKEKHANALSPFMFAPQMGMQSIYKLQFVFWSKFFQMP